MDTTLAALRALRGADMAKLAVSAEWMRKMLTSRAAMEQLSEEGIEAAIKGKTRRGIGGVRKMTSGDILKGLKTDKAKVKHLKKNPFDKAYGRQSAAQSLSLIHI